MCITLFCTFLCRHCRTTSGKCLMSRFTEDVNKWWLNFLSFLNLNMVLRNSAQKEFACIWQSKSVGVIAIEIERMQFWWPSPSWHLKLPNNTVQEKAQNQAQKELWNEQINFISYSIIVHQLNLHSCPVWESKLTFTPAIASNVKASLNCSSARTRMKVQLMYCTVVDKFAYFKSNLTVKLW